MSRDTASPLAAATKERGPQLSPDVRRRLLEQLKEIYHAIDKHYPDFIDAARLVLKDKSSSPRFEFILRRLWMEDVGEPPSDWEKHLIDRYEDFERKFDWNAPAGVSTKEEFLAKTLSVWQRRYVIKLKIRHAAEIVHAVESLA